MANGLQTSPDSVAASNCTKPPGLNDKLTSLDLSVIYDADPRPTFIVDTFINADAKKFVLSYTNTAFSDHSDLRLCLQDTFISNTSFYSWVLSPNHKERYYRYGGALWFGFTVQDRWRVIGTASILTSLDHEILNTPTPHSVNSESLSGDQDASYEATISRLKEEIRIHEFHRKQADREKQACWDSVQRLRGELRSLESGTPQPELPQATPTTSASDTPALVQTSSTAKRQTQRGNAENASDEHNSPPEQSLLRPSVPGRSPSPTPKIILPVKITGDGDASVALEKFQRLAEAVDVGFFDFDPSAKLLHANDSWYDLSGHPRDPAQHTVFSFTECVHPDDTELVMQQWDKLLKGQAVTFEMRWKKPAPSSAGPGAPVGAQWVLSACVPVIGEDGVVKSISGCTTDINAQKQTAHVALQRAEALERARASEERFARFAEVAPIAIFRFDNHKNIEYCNDRWFEMTGMPKSRFEDIQWPFGVHEDDIEMCSQNWERAIIDRSIGQIEFRLRKEWHDTHGRRGQAWAYCTFFAEFTEDGTFNGLMGSLLDISHLKWAENMQKLRAEEALEAKRQQENFIDITSHEMRNPLSAMVQCADTIMTSISDISAMHARSSQFRTSEDNKELQEHLATGVDAVQTILSCAAHQRRIVDDILTLSKLDSNLLLITPVKTDPIEMVHNVFKMFEMDASQAGIELKRELCDSLKSLNVNWLMLDPSRVSQILINLLGNAIKFTRTEDTRKVTVRLSVSLKPPSQDDSRIDFVPAESIMDDLGDSVEEDSEPLYLKFEVQDTGRGLDSEEKQKLFLRFSQASPKTHVQYGGSGLGLFISRKLTEMQGGEIGFASEAQVGSTFSFYIKSHRVDPPMSTSDPLTSTRSRDRGESTPTPSLKRKRDLRVLLVEDNLVNQKVLSKQLERQGCKVFLAGHGGEALDFLRTTALWSSTTPTEGVKHTSDPISIDVVLMDIEMPVMGGLECTRKIRKLEEGRSIIKHVPIVSISANARQEQVNEAVTAGVNDTITKPFRIKELMPKLHKLVDA